MGTRHHVLPLHPATAACRDCEWRYDPVLAEAVREDRRDAAATAHIEATGHQVTLSMPGYPGYAVLGPVDR